jgi:hypothetical protein
MRESRQPLQITSLTTRAAAREELQLTETFGHSQSHILALPRQQKINRWGCSKRQACSRHSHRAKDGSTGRWGIFAFPNHNPQRSSRVKRAELKAETKAGAIPSCANPTEAASASDAEHSSADRQLQRVKAGLRLGRLAVGSTLRPICESTASPRTSWALSFIQSSYLTLDER